jgi:hypothetical protein
MASACPDVAPACSYSVTAEVSSWWAEPSRPESSGFSEQELCQRLSLDRARAFGDGLQLACIFGHPVMPGWAVKACLGQAQVGVEDVRGGPKAGPGRGGEFGAELLFPLAAQVSQGLGQPQEHVLRQTVMARRLAAAAGLPEEQQTAVFYVSLLAWVGCVADSHEMAVWFGDDLRLRADSYEVDKAGVPRLRFVLGHVGEGSGSVRRLTMIGRFLTAGPARITRSMLGHCQATGDIASRLGLGAQVGGALQQAFERWEGNGVPGLRVGEQIDPAMRVVHIADDAEVFHRVHGVDAASEMLRSRRATEFDPALVDLFCLTAWMRSTRRTRSFQPMGIWALSLARPHPPTRCACSAITRT